MRKPARDPIAWDRCLLALEPLEARENPAPVVFGPSFGSPTTFEDVPVSFSGSNSFFVSDNPAAGTYTATLAVTTSSDDPPGVIRVDPAAAVGLSIGGNGTATVTLTGSLLDINTFLQSSGFAYDSETFSGEASVRVSIVGDSGASDPSAVRVNVRPVASAASVSTSASSEVLALSGPRPLSGLFTVSGWTDTDGSETATVTFTLSAPNASSFRLLNGTSELNVVGPGRWELEVTNAAELQAVFDALVLEPPSGFSGRVTLVVSGSLVDSAVFPASEGSETTNPVDLGGGAVNLRFFGGTNVVLPQGLTAPEGGTIDLGGRFVGEDPDLLSGDTSVFTLTAPAGLLTFRDSALVVGMTAERAVNGDGSTTITLTGDLDAINAFLATAGSLMYSAPDPDFSGVLPIAVTLANRPGSLGTGSPVLVPRDVPMFAPLVVEPLPGEAPGKFGDVVPLMFMPEADDLFPVADDAVTTQDTPVEVLMGLAALPTDASESVVLIVEGVPDGAQFTAGTDLGDGMWALALSDLDGLVFVPPPGAVGVFDLSVKVVVTDADPQSGMSDSATQATTFTITVLPAAAPTLDDDPDEDVPTDDTDDFDDFVSDFEDETDAAAFEDSADGGTTTAEVSADPDGETETRPEELETEPAVLPEAIASATTETPVGLSEGRVGVGAPGAGSLFARPESPQVAYGGNEKHPLPPVLPLDQSSSAAGFTDSGGDSFTLIDQLLRGTVPSQADAKPAAPEPAADLPKPDANARPPIDAPTDEAAAESEWRYWVAGGAIAGAATAWTLLSLERNSRLRRALRRLRHPTRRPAQAH